LKPSVEKARCRAKEWYYNNREKAKERIKARALSKPDLVYQECRRVVARHYKEWEKVIQARWPILICEFCGEKILKDCLFHHPGEKNFHVSVLKGLAVSEKRLRELSIVFPTHRSCHGKYHNPKGKRIG